MTRGQNKGSFRKGIVDTYRNVDNLSAENIQKHHFASTQTKKKLSTIISQAPQCEIDFCSKKLGHIKLRKLLHPVYKKRDILNFFAVFDNANMIVISVEDNKNPYLQTDSLSPCLFTVVDGGKIHCLPAQLFWILLPHTIRDKVKEHKDRFAVVEEILSGLGMEVKVRNLPSKT